MIFPLYVLAVPCRFAKYFIPFSVSFSVSSCSCFCANRLYVRFFMSLVFFNIKQRPHNGITVTRKYFAASSVNKIILLKSMSQYPKSTNLNWISNFAMIYLQFQSWLISAITYV